MKVLCFTTSFNRPYFLYNTINNISNQSYKDITYSININYILENEISEYSKLLRDFENDNRIKISFFPKSSQQNNYINAISSGDDNHDIFIKIDDDDIYHKLYIEKAVEIFNTQQPDILSFISDQHINNNMIYGSIDKIGYNHVDGNREDFGMPSTYIFNRKAYNLISQITNDDVKKIHLWEDVAWRKAWRDNNLKTITYNIGNMMTYNIHHKNTSSTFMLRDNINDIDTKGIATDYCDILYFTHHHWSSYIIINKRNNRVYNIKNDDHGRYRMNNDIISITWDNYGTEKFKRSNQNIYEII